MKLARTAPDQAPVLSTVLSMCKSRVIDQQVAACLCATNIIRAGFSPQYLHMDHSSPMTVTHVVNSLISSEMEKPITRTKACYIMYYLVCDDKDLCQLAFDRGSLTKLANLVRSITPSEPAPGWDEDEPESIARLREAALTAIAAIALFEDDIRSEVTDTLRMIPHIQISLAHHHPAVRYAACQCVRSLSRAVSVLRTSIVDSGLGLSVYQVFCKEDEDPRVRHAASSVICNLVTDFSPMKETLLSQGVIERCVKLLDTPEQALALNALWTFKNLLYKSNTDLKRQVMEALGWRTLQRLLTHESPDFQEHAFHVARNIADNEAGIEMVFEGLGPSVLLSTVSQGLDSEHDDVLRQAAFLLGNLANSPKHQRDILSHPRILISLRQCLIDAKVDVRRPAVACVRELIRANPHSYRELHDAGIDTTLRHMCDYGGGLAAASPMASAFSMGVEEDSEVREKAREALRWLERSGEMGM
ncbi:uncharacterized protein PHACADRAFT_255760 [Phanerochaete carnosa HHB-10118-sp]|uniref:Uncharacterized protein n=1 Tax=Phanerochaete carnosa (strain HHB-10118-sp) TaxID=650164 RepID=K5UYN9_PHACS|nr:uncharacterized protein PHACADRAFT_255760 [Phanerochaete carnosa HHB-10118-sp]EKM55266.1 hypothetical protein PHACADRAFT_255760 [Phanerochaete carnosa HHB-10118-sp]